MVADVAWRSAGSVETRAPRQTRKVTSSGVIWVDGHAYYVSRHLAGSVIPIDIDDGRLVIDVTIPLRKVYRLPKPAAHAHATEGESPAS
jgi:hypothetical protein